MSGGPDRPDGARAAPFGRWGTRLYDGLGYVAGGVLGAMTLAVFVQVVLRYLGVATIDGLDEVPRYLFVWLVMLGAAAAMHRGEHTALEYFRNRWSRRTQAVARAVTEAAGIALFASLVRSSLVLVPNAQLQTSAGLGLPLGYVFAAVPVGAVLVALPMAWRLVQALSELWPRRS
ncbi:MAG TPA: TRAP transporter small permease [Candidatus Tectomicrobia bacterium]|nr:TRAP transporter small permease [Candidatus Tectomicrobia bacterium]